ncbi:hypothetical protein [Solibaculum mannosilyticum]|uniref:hypothetical protein n=1 Tax=Solibaculum mannosilyticum TaxID=2780922 RepID=UPI0014959EAF|nr:hypothetical protein [Solibaculum mannosilyticum]
MTKNFIENRKAAGYCPAAFLFDRIESSVSDTASGSFSDWHNGFLTIHPQLAPSRNTY